MDLNSVGILIQKIMINYPADRRHFLNQDGKISLNVAQEWFRLIGYMDYDDALSRLDAYMEDPENRKAPRAVDFRLTKPKHSVEYFRADIDHQWKIIRSRLFDEEDREYVIDPNNGLPFFWNANGCAAQGNQIYPHIRRGKYPGMIEKETDEAEKEHRLKILRKWIAFHESIVAEYQQKIKKEEENERAEESGQGSATGNAQAD